MLTPNELQLKLESTSGTLNTSINKLPSGKYQIDATFYDKDGYYVAHKSSTRIVDTIEDLIS